VASFTSPDPESKDYVRSLCTHFVEVQGVNDLTEPSHQATCENSRSLKLTVRADHRNVDTATNLVIGQLERIWASR